MSLTYCPRCGKLFAKGIRDVCHACFEEIEKEYERCAEYLRGHKGATIHEVSEATEVSVKQITKFIREGRISTANLDNMFIPCEVCGLPIKEGNMCGSCRSKLQRDISNLRQPEQVRPPIAGGNKRNTFNIRDRE
jgi:flagellar operon protein (TIGR03826 family)